MLPKPKPDVVYGALPDGAVLFFPSEELYFGLNPTGACVWENLSPVRGTVEEVCAEVERRFPDAAPERVRRDVDLLLEALAENGLTESA